MSDLFKSTYSRTNVEKVEGLPYAIRRTTNDKVLGVFRILLGGLFVMTGLMKLFVPMLGEAWSGQLIAANIPFYAINVRVVPVIEVLVGLLLILGLYARIGGLVVINLMLVATYVHSTMPSSLEPAGPPSFLARLLSRQVGELLSGPVTVNLVEVRQRKNDLVDTLRTLPMGMIEQNRDLDLIMGEATFTGPTSIQVRSNEGTITHLIADTIIIATGGRPAMPPIPGLNNVPTLNSTSIMDLDTIPEHLLVHGCSPVRTSKP